MESEAEKPTYSTRADCRLPDLSPCLREYKLGPLKPSPRVSHAPAQHAGRGEGRRLGRRAPGVGPGLRAGLPHSLLPLVPVRGPDAQNIYRLVLSRK